MNTKLGIVLAAVLFSAVGCATDGAAPSDQLEVSGEVLTFESEADADDFRQSSSLQADPEEEVLAGCSNAEIRTMQAICRTPIQCPSGSRGIHFCDRQPTFIEAQCDCRTGNDTFAFLLL